MPGSIACAWFQDLRPIPASADRQEKVCFHRQGEACKKKDGRTKSISRFLLELGEAGHFSPNQPEKTDVCVCHTLRTNAMRSARFVGGCVATAVAAVLLQSSPAGAFAPPAFTPAGPGPVSYCRACSSATASSALPRSVSRSSGSSQQARGWWGARRSVGVTRMSSTDIESPFASPGMADMGEGEEDTESLLTLTLENVETVLDEMRPYLMSDG